MHSYCIDLAGLPSPTYNEIWKVVAGSTQFGSSSTDSAAALGALNSQVAALRSASSRQSAGENVLSIADGVWTKGIELNPAYANSMKALFKVCMRSGTLGVHVSISCSCDPCSSYAYVKIAVAN